MYQDLGQQIQMTRKKKRITLSDFAKKLGISVGYLSNLETGKTYKVDLLLLDKIQKELN
jgi:transcriptional regulator with XRE-family HTH domain